MSYKIRGKGAAYDNIAVGSATGRERIISGQAATSEVFGGIPKARTLVAVAQTPTTDQPFDNIAIGGVAPVRDNPATTPASS